MAETLLAKGAYADEQRLGTPSTLQTEYGEFPITPLLAAMVRGHWDLAELLMAHGAVCDPEQQMVQRLWSLFYGEKSEQMIQANFLP